MSQSQNSISVADHGPIIVGFLREATGFEIVANDQKRVEFYQLADGKLLAIEFKDVEEILTREDSQGQPFLQINYQSGTKILLTTRLVGFKPVQVDGLDDSRLPKVVTTPDLMSVIEAIDDSVSRRHPNRDEVETLRRIFNSILEGGEAVGFDLRQERSWMPMLGSARSRASA